jgi:curved DNA-binding protein CbpA
MTEPDDRLRHLIPDIGEYRNKNHEAVEAWSINPNEPYKERDTTNGYTQESFAKLYDEAFTAVNPNTLFFAYKDPYGIQFQTMPTFRSKPPPRYPSLTTVPGMMEGDDDEVAEMERNVLMGVGGRQAVQDDVGLVDRYGLAEAVDIAVLKDKAQPAEYS